MAQLLPLLAAAVDPHAESHEDDPAGTTDASNKCRLLDHICDLLSQAQAALLTAVAIGTIASTSPC